jgi:general nucleoside transport system permease protein
VSLTSEETVARRFTYENASGVVVPVLSVVLAMGVGGIVVALAGNNPLNAYRALFQGAFGSWYDLSETLLSSIPLMIAGLSVAFAFRAGLFNIGAEGQLTVGALVSAYLGYTLNMPGYILIPVALIGGALGGAAWAGIAGVLKAWRGTHEVITTMMLNFIALNLSHYMLESSPATGQPGPMAQHFVVGNPETLPMNAHLPVIVPNSIIANGRLHAGLLVALLLAFIFWFLLWRTSLGYKIRAVGLSPKAAAYAGINVGWNIVLAMLIAGAFAGLAGMVSLYGVAPYQLTDVSAGIGFNAIAVALLGRNNATGTIAAAILFGAFQHGGALMQVNANISIHLVDIIQGLIIFFVGAEMIVRRLYLAGASRPRLPLSRKAAA